MSKYILAIDQGTTSSRAILYDLNIRQVAKYQIDIVQYYPYEGWVEHDPLEIWQSQLECCRQVILKANASPEDILTIGITNQRETLLAWDRHSHEPISPAIVWQDRRTADDCLIDLDQIGLERNRYKTGLNLDAYFSASKMRWILRNIPKALELQKYDRLCIGTIDSWLLFKLTGGKIFATDYSNASRTNIFNIQQLEWDKDLLQYYQISESILPRVIDTIGMIGMTDSTLLGAPIAISCIAGDQQAALFGHRCYQKGMMKNTFGTGCFLLQNIGNEFKISKHQLLTTIAWKKGEELAYALEGSVFNAGAALKWLKENLNLFSDYNEADNMAASVQDTDQLYMVPAFTGLGAPHWDMTARGLLLGLNRNTKKEHIVRATFESLAYQCKDIVDTLSKDSGVAITSLQIDGGVSKSPFLQQFLADLLQINIVLNHSEECTALGAAMMAAEGMNIDISIDALLKTKTIYPQPKDKKMEIKYAQWNEAVERSKNWV